MYEPDKYSDLGELKKEDIDPVKWDTHITRGELFQALQQVRNMTYFTVANSSWHAAGRPDEADKSYRSLKQCDDALMEFLTSMVRRDAADE